MFCPSCGKKIADGSKFCPECGATVSVAAPPSQRRPAQVASVQTTKSLGIALALTILFGPLGLLYATVRGALILIATDVVLFFIYFAIVIGSFSVASAGGSDAATGGAMVFAGILVLFGLLTWPASIVWSWIAVRDYNDNVRNGIMNDDVN